MTRLRNFATLFLALLAAQAVAVMLTVQLGATFVVPFILVLSFFLAVFLVTSAWSVISGAPFVPTDYRNVEAMLDIADVTERDTVLDLGAGDGRIIVAAAQRGARAEGWEISPFLWLLAQRNIRRSGVADRAVVHLGSFWNASVAHGSVVTLFFIDTKMDRMMRKLRRELVSGARIVSYVFTFNDWPAAREGGNGVRLYRIDDAPDI